MISAGPERGATAAKGAEAQSREPAEAGSEDVGFDLREDRRVALVREGAVYCKTPPYHPSEPLPEWPGMAVSRDDNPAYRAVRQLFRLLELDAAHFGTARWNPLGNLVWPGNTVVLKPNLVSHFNMGAKVYGLTDTDSLVTHGSVIRAVVDYVARALEGRGRIIIADCPVQGTAWEELVRLVGLDQIEKYAETAFPGLEVEVKDYRLGRAVLQGETIVERLVDESALDRYLEVDLGRESLLTPLMREPYAFGVAQYPRARMRQAHTLERNVYLFPKDILDADVVINLPKMKTHMKAGITGALKNLVGINGHKDYLPHFRFGSPKQGGDEYPDGNWLWDLMWKFTHLDWEFERGRRKQLYNFLARVCAYLFPWLAGLDRGAGALGGGSWHGNDTLWRTVLDINRAFLYFDRVLGKVTPRLARERRYLAILDGLMVGHRESPLCPTPIPGGIMMASFNPLAMDALEAAMLGLDVRKIKQVAEGFGLPSLPLVKFTLEEVRVLSDLGLGSIEEVYRTRAFVACEPSRGFRGQVEYAPGK